MRIVRSGLLVLLGCLSLSPAAFAQTAPPPAAPPADTSPVAGRFQMVVVPGNSGSPFLLDTTSGCVWHIFQDEKTKRSTFVEVDVENLHWSWGSGAQQILASRVDGSNLTDEQKRTLKQDLQKTTCGVSHVVLTPGAPSTTGRAPAASDNKPAAQTQTKPAAPATQPAAPLKPKK